MLIFNRVKTSEDMLATRVFDVRLQLNLAFKISYSPSVPFSFEIGLGLITISYEVFNFRRT